MAAELDEYTEAFGLSSRLQDSHRELKEFSWIVSPLMVAAGALLGNLGAGYLELGASPTMIGGGAILGTLGAVGFNLDIFRRGKRAVKVRARYEALEAELFSPTKEINP